MMSGLTADPGLLRFATLPAGPVGHTHDRVPSSREGGVAVEWLQPELLHARHTEVFSATFS
jgi:hypothetical protein